MNRETSTFQIELAQPQDDAELRALLRQMPMGEAIQVLFLREPSYFLTSDIQGTSVQTFVGKLGGQIIGLGTRAIRPGHINGNLQPTGYLGDLRLLTEHRGGTFVARAYRFLRKIHQDGQTNIYSTVIVEDNTVALKTIAANRAGLPRYTPLGRIHSPAIYLKKRKPALTGSIVPGSKERWGEIVEKLNENKMQFAPAYSLSDFESGRFHGLRPEHFYLHYRGSHLAGVMATWDQSTFRQTVIHGYSGLLKHFRPLINLVRRPPLPKPGAPLRFFFIAFVSTDDVESYAALLRHAYNDHLNGNYTHFIPTLHEADPRAVVLQDYESTPFGGRLFAVTMDAPPSLDGRVPYVEGGLL